MNLQDEYKHNRNAHVIACNAIRYEKSHTKIQEITMPFTMEQYEDQFADTLYISGEITHAEWVLAKQRIAERNG